MDSPPSLLLTQFNYNENVFLLPPSAPPSPNLLPSTTTIPPGFSRQQSDRDQSCRDIITASRQ